MGYANRHGMNATEISKPDIILSTGRVVRHTRMANGAHNADMADGGDMSESEWEDYCSILAKRNAAFIERQRNLRKQEALTAIAARHVSV